ncbi:diacylglycerol kinase family lipid kinase [Pedococcus ginsenosidimutans]|uniref:Diacylglycerol kinase family lipid kinase n=1 Tax=Pedococcus ginsenosidimutans TaxID=490570 RepID=A0ABP8XSX1_9MICO
MPSFDRVVLIFNPNSTGEAQQRAADLRRDLAQRSPDLVVEMLPTEHAGHATELARTVARSGVPLVVSVSGDGGYNEVVNGVMQAGNEQAVAAVLAAGNANDHRRATQEQPMAEAIIRGDVSRIDLLRFTSDGPDGRVVRHAHSYIGLGLTPVVAVDLEKGGKGSLREMVTVVRSFAKFRPFEIETDDAGRESFDSLVFANIAQMAKVATLAEDQGRPDDGMFEVITLRHTAKWRILATAIKASTTGLGKQPSVRTYAFTTVTPLPLQVDGEVVELPTGTAVRVDIVPDALRTLL